MGKAQLLKNYKKKVQLKIDMCDECLNKLPQKAKINIFSESFRSQTFKETLILASATSPNCTFFEFYTTFAKFRA